MFGNNQKSDGVFQNPLKDYSEVNIDVLDDFNEIFNEVDTPKEGGMNRDTAMIRKTSWAS